VSRWIVSNVPSWLLLVGLIVIVAGGAVLAQVYVRHRFPGLKEDAHNDVTRFAYGVVAFVYAFFVGFIVSVMWGQINTADAKARTEGAVGVQMARDLSVFDKADSDRIRQSLLDYERAAVVEWPLAAPDRSFPEVDSALARVYTAYEQVQPRNDTQKTLLATSFTNFGNISEARTERLIQARTDVGTPWPCWAIILLTSALVLGGAIIYGVETPARHYPMVATVGVVVAAILFLVLELSNPFVGEISTSSEPLREVIGVLSQPPA
jgi:hypothetical protein